MKSEAENTEEQALTQTEQSQEEILVETDEQDEEIPFVQLIEFKNDFDLRRVSKRERKHLKETAFLLFESGFSIVELSYILRLPLKTISAWRSEATEEQSQRIAKAEVSAVSGRVANTLNTTLASVERVALYVSEREYIQKQDPLKVAKMFEMLTGFSMRLIEARQRASLAEKQIAQSLNAQPGDPYDEDEDALREEKPPRGQAIEQNSSVLTRSDAEKNQ